MGGGEGVIGTFWRVCPHPRPLPQRERGALPLGKEAMESHIGACLLISYTSHRCLLLMGKSKHQEGIASPRWGSQ